MSRAPGFALPAALGQRICGRQVGEASWTPAMVCWRVTLTGMPGSQHARIAATHSAAGSSLANVALVPLPTALQGVVVE
jgi:hypothetical protein